MVEGTEEKEKRETFSFMYISVFTHFGSSRFHPRRCEMWLLLPLLVDLLGKGHGGIHSWTSMISRVDQCNSIGTIFQATRNSKHSWDPQHRVISKKGRIIFMSTFNDIEYWVKDNQQECLANATDSTEYAKQFKLGHWCSCGLGQEKVWYRTCSNKPNGAWDQIARKMTQKFEEASHPIFSCGEPTILYRRSQVEEEQADHSLSEYDSNNDNQYSHCFGMQSVMHLCRSVCLVRSEQSKKEARHREGPELPTDDLTNLTHRRDLTASGDRVRDS